MKQDIQKAKAEKEKMQIEQETKVKQATINSQVKIFKA